MAKFVLSAFADEYDERFAEQLDGMKKLGIGFIELRGVDGKNVSELSPGAFVEIKTLLKHAGIKVSSIGSPLGKISVCGDMHAHLEIAKQLIDAAATLETKFIRIFSFYPERGMPSDEFEKRAIDSLARLLETAEGTGITFCHENEARVYGEDPVSCRHLLDIFPQLGCVFDMGNFALEGYDAYAAYLLLQDRISYFHIKDALQGRAIVPPGKGEARIADILHAWSTVYDGQTFVSLEPHLASFSGRNTLIGRSFCNPFVYSNARTAFIDAYEKVKGLL